MDPIFEWRLKVLQHVAELQKDIDGIDSKLQAAKTGLQRGDLSQLDELLDIAYRAGQLKGNFEGVIKANELMKEVE